MHTPVAICVYCSSKDEISDVYKAAAVELGQLLAKKNITLIYGGGDRGLMGILAHTTMAAGGKVTGYMPTHLRHIEKPDLMITEFHFVNTMHERKQKMFEHAEAFFVLPGGFGTIDEASEIITWRQIGLHNKPVIFININGYWDPFKALCENIFSQNFAHSHQRDYFSFVESVPVAFEKLEELPLPSKETHVDWV